jgi:RHS repeat-associated protein
MLPWFIHSVSIIGNSVAFGYDANNNASTFIDTVNGTTYTTSYTYDKDNRPTLVTSPKANTTEYVYDVLGRLTFKKWKVGAMEYSTSFTYKNHPTDTSLTSTQVVSVQNGSSPSIAYVYDANGNITSITEGTNTIQYVYNELNEVVRENNQRDHKSFVYHYDLGGNLLSKVEYAYTTATLGTPISTISYVYTNTNWKDQLTSFNGKVITYDAIGNPLTYDGTTYSWQGRQLVSSSKAGLNINYIYNDAGIRTSKSVNGVTTSYRLSGDKVTFEQTGSDTIYYVYDTQGQLISMILNNVEYAYVRNAQNDIVGLINSAGIQVVSYTYSTWGEVLSITGSLASSVGQKNPYRYRGYRYDSETQLYYLQSRYYNPQWGRFVNAYQIISENHILGTNLLTYCLNNPINMIDIDGREAMTLTALSLYALGTLVTGMYGFAVMSTPQAQRVFNNLFKEISTNISHGLQVLGGMTIGAISLASSKANAIAKSIGNSFARTINTPK